jgi:hypothetical protein
MALLEQDFRVRNNLITSLMRASGELIFFAPISACERGAQRRQKQALHTSVIHRKVTDGFRSEWGAKADTDLLSVITTSKIKGQRVYETLVRLLGTESRDLNLKGANVEK